MFYRWHYGFSTYILHTSTINELTNIEVKSWHRNQCAVKGEPINWSTLLAFMLLPRHVTAPPPPFIFTNLCLANKATHRSQFCLMLSLSTHTTTKASGDSLTCGTASIIFIVTPRPSLLFLPNPSINCLRWKKNNENHSHAFKFLKCFILWNRIKDHGCIYSVHTRKSMTNNWNFTIVRKQTYLLVLSHLVLASTLKHTAHQYMCEFWQFCW